MPVDAEPDHARRSKQADVFIAIHWQVCLRLQILTCPFCPPAAKIVHRGEGEAINHPLSPCRAFLEMLLLDKETLRP